MGKAVKVGDQGTDHDGFPPTAVISGSPNVNFDNMAAARVGDALESHDKPKHPPHPRTIASGSSSVFINGKPAAITGGAISCGGVTIGSGSVNIGDYVASKSAGNVSAVMDQAKKQVEPDQNINLATQQNSGASQENNPNFVTTSLSTFSELLQGKDSIDDEMDKKWLIVPKGSLTFDSEGDDQERSVYFTRVPHIPHNGDEVIGESGITIGRGLDLGSRKASQVNTLFKNAAQHANPISEALLTWLKGGAGKKKQDAFDYWKTLDAQVPKEEQHITRKIQYYLFQGIYSEYEEKTKELTTKADVCKMYLGGKKVDWDALPENVKEVLTDLTYRGDYTGSDDTRGNTRKVIVPAVYKDQQEGLKGEGSYFYEVMDNRIFWSEVFGVVNGRILRRRDTL
ncbi:type VI secretion system PAAR protein [Marinomonas primoryensis]|uniref:Type VI secretion system PAAR protein n=1 Tax=Marinomonas primoryensis TaxID=178399 RepID=A0ABV0L2R8_9GAMM